VLNPPARPVIWTPGLREHKALAEKEAEFMRQPVGSGHFLLAAIWSRRTVLIHALPDLGVGPDVLAREVRRELESRTDTSLTTIVHVAMAGARGRGDPHVGIEHVLRATTRRRLGAAARALETLGLRESLATWLAVV